METLETLGALIQALPDVSDVSEEGIKGDSEDELNSLLKKQSMRKEYLANLEKEQESLNKNAEEHREELEKKRGKLQELQQELSAIRTEGPWASTEEQIVTLVNPDGLERKVSNVTLVEDSLEEGDLDEGMEENEQYLEEQERSLNELRQRIEMLQQVKKELESAQNAANEADLTTGENAVTVPNQEAYLNDAEESNETLETLLRKLASASIEEISAVDFTAAVKQSEMKEPLMKESNADKVVTDNFEHEEADQATQHLKDLKVAIASTDSPEEKQVYMELHSKLSQQLLELVEVESKLKYYRSILNDNKEEEPTAQNASDIVIAKSKTTSQLDVSKVVKPVSRLSVDSTTAHRLQIESLVNSKRSVLNAWSDVSKTPKASQFYESSNSESGSFIHGKRPESSLMPRGISSSDIRRPTSSMTVEGSWKSDCSSKSKILFDSMKGDIYRHAASLITSFESEPYFLLSFLKKISKIDSSYLKQKLLVTLDNLLEEDLEVQSAGSAEDDSIVNKNYSDQMNTDCEIVIKSRISEFLMGMTQDSSHQILNALQLSKLNNFVLDVVHTVLSSTISMSAGGSEEINDRLTILIDLFKPALDQKTEVFQGKRLCAIQAEILSSIFEEIHQVCEEWAK